MPKQIKNSATRTNAGATVGYEAQLWQMADALRGSMDAAEYKHVVLGLLFLKYISDAFEERHTAPILDKYHGFVGPIWQRKYAGENNILGALRDALLPKLISGDLRVKDAGKLIAEAV